MAETEPLAPEALAMARETFDALVPFTWEVPPRNICSIRTCFCPCTVSASEEVGALKDGAYPIVSKSKIVSKIFPCCVTN